MCLSHCVSPPQRLHQKTGRKTGNGEKNENENEKGRAGDDGKVEGAGASLSFSPFPASPARLLSLSPASPLTSLRCAKASPFNIHIFRMKPLRRREALYSSLLENTGAIAWLANKLVPWISFIKAVYGAECITNTFGRRCSYIPLERSVGERRFNG